MTIILPAGCFMMCARISPVLITKVDTTLPIIIRSGNLLANKFDVTTGNISKLEINKTPILRTPITTNTPVRAANM